LSFWEYQFRDDLDMIAGTNFNVPISIYFLMGFVLVWNPKYPEFTDVIRSSDTLLTYLAFTLSQT